MFKFLVGLLPKEYRNLIEVGLRVISQLDTPEERAEALNFARLALADGKVTPGEWAQIGSKFGILRGPSSDEVAAYSKRSPKKPNA
tara:strand:- start:307 stop:564 length:258 start_codon:yes stop_codon:yes gene_type:complete